MAHRIEERDIVIDGWENGIAEDPYSGISDMRGMNPISVPKEISNNFATTKISTPTLTTGTVTSVDIATDTLTYTGATDGPTGLEDGMSVIFSASTITGVSTSTVYWVKNVTSTTFNLYSNFALSTIVNVTVSGTGTFTAHVMATPQHSAYDSFNDYYYLVDTSGRVWTNKLVTSGGYWRYTGNSIDATSNGNGLVYYQASDGTGFIFVFRNSRIDYTSTTTISWVYGWDPIDGTTGNTDAYLNSAADVNHPHSALVGQDNTVYYCDNTFIGSFFQKDPAVPFVPTTLATYTFGKQALALPRTDQALCLAELGTNLLVGGSRNAIYPWNRIDTSFTYPILLPEFYIKRMETVNTTTYIFVGNRGRIYMTNGAQAKLYKKIPDHLSGTIEPYYTWGGTASLKNQLYFGISATNNVGTAINNYGGLWAIDMDTGALRLAERLSYGNNSGIASLVIARQIPIAIPVNPSGIGLYIGWVGGLDSSSPNPHTDYVAYVDTELLPIGTYLKKRTFENVEFKLSTPMVAGEGIRISYRKDFTDSYTLLGETLYSATADTNKSDFYLMNFENSQWLQFRVETKSVTDANRSYVRLKELRLR